MHIQLHKMGGPAVVILFLVIAIQLQLSVEHRTLLDMGKDASIFASYAAGMNHPDAFKSDVLLSDQKNIQFYNTIHIAAIRYLGPIIGSYDKVFVYLTGIHAFIFLLGWYLFGMEFMHHRFLAFLMACLFSLRTDGLYDTWVGLMAEPLPRVSFDAVLGYLLAATLRWGHHPKAHVWIVMLFVPCLYLHPPFAALMGLFTWLIFLLRRTQGKGIRFLIVDNFGINIGFLGILITCYVSFASHVTPVGQVDPSAVYQIYLKVVPIYADSFPELMRIFINLFNNGLLPMAFIGGFGIYYFGTYEQKQRLKFIVAWAGFILFFAFLSIILQKSNWLSVKELMYTMYGVQGFRYLFPILIALSLWIFVIVETNLSKNISPLLLRIGLVIIILTGTGTFKKWEPYFTAPKQSYWNLLEQLSKEKRRKQLEIEMIEAIQNLTLPDAHLLPLNVEPEVIRYAALRSVIHGSSDFSSFIYSNHRAVITWFYRESLVEDVKNLWDSWVESKEWQEQLETALDCMLLTLKPDYIVSNYKKPVSIVERHGRKIIFENSKFMLIDVRNATSANLCRKL
ncbi:MAG: hypothetical protein HQL77_16935 [Magnetococcales bacterium]|nr:hypothetical protein [Magnetococcales bacterium]